MKTFNYEVFIGTPSDVVSNVADSINNTFGKHGVHVKKTHKGVHDELIITVDDETYAWDENDIFQLGSLIGRMSCKVWCSRIIMT